MPTIAEILRNSDRLHIGYEDYSPEGRVAMNTFMANKGNDNLQRQLATYQQYQQAQQKAMQAAYLKLLERQGTDVGMPVYQYPPNEPGQPRPWSGGSQSGGYASGEYVMYPNVKR